MLFPFLFASSWLGNLILTVLAFFLAFTHDGPLSPLVFLTVALCILAGNLLPIGSYFLFIKWRESELKAESAQASLRVRDALKRSEEVMSRLDEAEGALSKTILIARQLPERITESFQAVEDLSEKINTLEVGSFTETLKGSSDSIELLKGEAAAIQEQVKELRKELSGLPKSLSKMVKEAIPEPRQAPREDADVSLGERLDLVYESLEAVQDSLDGLLSRIAAGTVAAEPTPFVEEEPDLPGTEADIPGAEADLPEEEPEFAAEEPDLAEEEPDPVKEAEVHAQEEMLLAHEEAPASAGDRIAADTARLSVRAMVGIRNTLFIRGDEPWLSWDEGRPMELVGIGEYAFEVDDLKEPIEVAVLLNDDLESDAGRIVLEPGKVVRISPAFLR